ncbi:MAG: NAD(P)-dependent oxidoreductase [Muribaculaceae bacterium]|nr:NAD(P)-dependent oxidoreductase [Muribaculaceae bacterium]
MKILITGANGYIGRHVVYTLIEKGYDVIACDITTTEIDSRAHKIDLNIFNLQEGNIFEQLGSPDVCLHMAWRNGFVHNSNTHIGDLSAHYDFLTRLIDGGLRQLAVMGSMHEVGYWEGAIDENTPCNPTSMYGIAKDALRRSILLYGQQHDTIIQWLRCYYILGDDLKSSSIFGKILKAEKDGKTTFPFTTGKNKYDFIQLDVLTRLIVATITQSKISGIINCCTGEPMSLAERVESFIKEKNLNIKLEYGVFPDRSYDSPCVYGDSSKINEILALKNET